MIVLVLILGFLAGVMINALADSLPLERKIRRVHCRACGAPRTAVWWSGSAALVFGRRNCPYCGQPRSWRAPLVEISMVFIALLIFHADPTPWAFWPSFLVASVFLLIMVIDIEHRLILHIVSVPAAVAIGLLGTLDPNRGLSKTLLGGLAGFGIVFGFFLLGGVLARLLARLRGQVLEEVAFGFGDVTLAGVIGLAVGWPGVVLAILLGVFAAGVYSFGHILVTLLLHRYSPFHAIPYGPFLILGAALVYFGGRELLARPFLG